MQFAIVPYSQVKAAGRIDADFFHPTYEWIARCVQSYSEGCDALGNLVNVDNAKYEPKKKQTYKYIELANVNGGEITGCTKDEGQNLPARARRKVSAGDVIVSSIEGSLSSIALVASEYDNALCSTGFHVVKSGWINAATLLVFLRSEIGQQLLKRGCTGTILSAISNDEFQKIELPKIKPEIQTQIQRKVEEAQKLMREAKEKYSQAQAMLLDDLDIQSKQDSGLI